MQILSRLTGHFSVPRRLSALLLPLALLLLISPPPLAAMSLSEAMGALGEAKAQGLVGEQPDGYLGVVRSNDRAENIVRLINQARRDEYRRVARENNIDLRDVELMAGQKAIDRTPTGQYIRMPDGQWRRK